MNEHFPTARDLMTQDYLVVKPSLGLLDAIVTLEKHPEDTAFVVDEQERFVGLLTEKECLHRVAARAYDEAIAETVGDVMGQSPVSFGPTADPYAIAQAFHSCPCGVLPIVEDGRVVGAVSQLNMLRAFLAVFRHRSTVQASVAQTAEDLKERPKAIERMQRVFAKLNRGQLATLLHRGK